MSSATFTLYTYPCCKGTKIHQKHVIPMRHLMYFHLISLRKLADSHVCHLPVSQPCFGPEITQDTRPTTCEDHAILTSDGRTMNVQKKEQLNLWLRVTVKENTWVWQSKRNVYIAQIITQPKPIVQCKFPVLHSILGWSRLTYMENRNVWWSAASRLHLCKALYERGQSNPHSITSYMLQMDS